jgi:hypothetical protein
MTAPRPDRPHSDLAELADLEAGVLDETRAREVRAAAESDPAARAVLEALAATRAELAALPDPSVPPTLAARWGAALQAEQSRLSSAPPSAAAGGPDAARDEASATARHEVHLLGDRPASAADQSAGPTEGRPPRRRWPRSRSRALLRRPAVLAGALLIAVLVVGGVLNARHEPLPLVQRPQLVAQGLSTIGVRDTGGLGDPARRTACLQAVAAPGVAPTAPLLGGRRVTFEGSPGVLLVLGTGIRGTFDVVIVDSACGQNGGGTLLAATHVAPP